MIARNPRPKVVVAGFGNEYRFDDGVGPLVATLVEAESGVARAEGPFSDPLDLLGVWNGAELAIVIDAVRSGAPPGVVRVVEVDLDARDDEASHADGIETRATSTHGIGLAGVLRLARAIGQAPRRVAVVAIEGERFGVGEGLSPAVEAAVPEAVQRVIELIREA